MFKKNHEIEKKERESRFEQDAEKMQKKIVLLEVVQNENQKKQKQIEDQEKQIQEYKAQLVQQAESIQSYVLEKEKFLQFENQKELFEIKFVDLQKQLEDEKTIHEIQMEEMQLKLNELQKTNL